VLAGCPGAKAQGRLTYRHNSVLKTLLDVVSEQLRRINSGLVELAAPSDLRFVSEHGKVYNGGKSLAAAQAKNVAELLQRADDWTVRVDIPDLGEQTYQVYPADVSEETKRPDMLITSVATRTLICVELTVPLEENIGEQHQTKLKKYAHLPAAGQANGWRVEVIAVEMGCIGSIGKSMSRLLEEDLCLAPHALARAKRELSNAARRSSFVMFQSRQQSHWSETGLMSGKDGQSLDEAVVAAEEEEDQEGQLAKAEEKKKTKTTSRSGRRQRKRVRPSAHAD